MKKYLLLACVFSAIVGWSQELSTLNADTHLWGEAGTSEAEQLSSHIDVKNESNTEYTLKCKREIVTEVAGSTNQFCWGGLCYGAETDESAFTETLAPGATSTSEAASGFTGYYDYLGNAGLTQVRYIFFDPDNSAISTEIVVSYCVDTQANCETVLGTNEIVSEVQFNAVPNPSSDNTLISYNMGRAASNAVLTITDVLGNKVKEIPLDSSLGVVNLSVSEFESGMYFYSLVNVNTVVSTKRLVVSH